MARATAPGDGPTSDDAPPAVELDRAGLRFARGEQRVDALDDVSLRIATGERVAVIGPSGGGKTSLLRVMAGLERLDAGAVRIEGRDVSTGMRAREHARAVGHVAQGHGLVPQLSALRNVLCGRLADYGPRGGLARFPEADRRAAAERLGRLGLGERLHQRAAKLSGGEKQRVAIARLLLQSPRILLLDEPISALDIHWARTAMEQLDAVRDGDAAILMVLHDLSLVRRWADRALFVRDGRIVFDGDPDEACRRLEELDERPSDEDRGASDDHAPGAGAPSHPREREAAEPLDLAGPEWTRRGFYGLAAALFAAACIGSVLDLEVTAADLFGGLGSAGTLLSRLFPPDVSTAPTLLGSLVETVEMALLGTTLAAVVALPLAVLAARNISPSPVRAVARLGLNLLRTIPSIVWGLFFVAMVGLGPLPGILALTFYAGGYLGKFYYEGIESIAPEPVRALQTVGASRIQRFRHGVFPQVLPLLTGYTLYMLEYNVRAASILGVVGAGGIGFHLHTYINGFDYDKATTALLMLLVVVTLIDAASSRIRRWLQD